MVFVFVLLKITAKFEVFEKFDLLCGMIHHQDERGTLRPLGEFEIIIENFTRNSLYLSNFFFGNIFFVI